MNTAAKNFLETKNELIAREKLVKVIREWVEKNKKIFWKYEVSSFYKTYVIKIVNLPEPSVKDISLSINRLLDEQHKQQLCDCIIKSCGKSGILSDTSIDIQIDYADGAVITGVI